MEKEKKQHYVDNKLFFTEMQKWKEEINEQEQVDDLPPMVTEYMAIVFKKLLPIYHTDPILLIIPIVRK